MVLLLIFLLYFIPLIIIHLIGYFCWKADPDAEDQHTIGEFYEYYAWEYDPFFIIVSWIPALNIILMVAFLFSIIFSYASKINIK